MLICMQRRGTRGSVVLFILRVASCLVLCALRKVRLLTFKVDNCNEVGSQLPHRTHISRASCLNNIPSKMMFWRLARVCKMFRHTPEDPLQYSVIERNVFICNSTSWITTIQSAKLLRTGGNTYNIPRRVRWHSDSDHSSIIFNYIALRQFQ